MHKRGLKGDFGCKCHLALKKIIWCHLRTKKIGLVSFKDFSHAFNTHVLT